MAHSISLAAPPQPTGSFRQNSSGAQFTVSNTAAGLVQTVAQNGSVTSLLAAYTIGSGSHAFGYVIQRGDYLFQSPISYYTKRRLWDMAPGYEESKNPDFTRPVTVECLSCHSDKPKPVADTLNRYQSPPLEGTGIQCDRCHGPSEAHLRNPVPGSIINPAKLDHAARDSICEQCHLSGAIRIPNAGLEIAAFKPGKPLEDTYTVYLSRSDSANTIKVVSQAEQLALSRCARKSEGKLWCGTCHDPHDALVQSAGYYSEKCLSCHAATLSKSHAAPTRDCVGCHMISLPAKDGGHTAFTDHRIRVHSEGGVTPESSPNQPLIAWREPQPEVRGRNLALALVTFGLEEHDSGQVIQGFRMLTRMERTFSNDAPALTELGTVLLTARQPAEAKIRFERALNLRSGYAPYEVNLASALMDEGDVPEGTRHLERAVQLDPLLSQAVQLLRQAYVAQGKRLEADELVSRYRAAMGIITKDSH